MGTCIVTKLNGEVNKEYLEPLGYITYRVKVSAGGGLKFPEATTVTLLDGTWKTTEARELVATPNTEIWVSTNSVTPDDENQEFFTVRIPKYSCCMYFLTLPYNPASKLLEVPGFKYIPASKLQGCVLNIAQQPEEERLIITGASACPIDKWTSMNAKYCNFKEPIDVTQLGANGALTSLDLRGSGTDGSITGSLDNTGFSNCNINGMPSTKGVSIDLVNFVNNHRSAGRTEGTRTMRELGNITVKANGTPMSLTSGKDYILAWNADSITLDNHPLDYYQS